jgi:TolB protein
VGTEFDVIDVETGATRKIATGFGLVRWARDGARITLSGFPCCYSPVAQIFTVNPDGTNLQQLTFDTQVSKNTGDWSPDGGLLAVTGTTWNAGNPYNALYVLRADATGMTQITDSVPSGNDPSASWSPDGSAIAFVGDGKYIGESPFRYRSLIYAVRPDGTALTQLSKDRNHDSNPSWSPDGKQILFSSERDGHAQIYLMNADGTSQVRLVTSLTNDRYPTWRRR